ncbi:putative peptidylglycine alpha-hydroxylating monooxygenase [Fasciola gigantica]|uniref:Putative peptidylglycine alpha-hydroxylating monooxygenase n=1 Tax=Fasciola gigantica TaxID=46835 RepID=A0A504X0V8_FASGI|nr:putative peptidylglycine alpha-hydroxylating monooxygenase [Fasciola gigantica]
MLMSHQHELATVLSYSEPAHVRTNTHIFSSSFFSPHPLIQHSFLFYDARTRTHTCASTAGFEAIHDPEVTHHMILFSCEEPGSAYRVWQCDGESGSRPVCNKEPKIIFSWAKSAPNFKLPSEISLPVGGERYRYLVLQVHYKDYIAFKNSPNKLDRSGFRITTAPEPTPNVAGIYLFASTQPVPANSNSTLKMQCTYTGRATLHPFAFRVHAHSHGKSHKLEAECHMVNKENREVPMGHTRQDEMCNFYMMYSVPLKDKDQLDSADFQVCDDTKLKEKIDKLEREVKLTLGKDFEDEDEEGETGNLFEELLPGSDFYTDRDFNLDSMGGY